MARIISNLAMLLLFGAFTFQPESAGWLREQKAGYAIYYTAADQPRVREYNTLIESGFKSVREFFGKPYKTEFSIFTHPNRHSLDSTWQKDWGMPDFKSECWMVASGVATKLDLISPATWDKESCEHKYSNKEETQKLITHELVHVFHGQHNQSPDFSDITGIDWLAEGLATYASGQCDAARMARVKEALIANTTPNKLDDFWKGQLRYGLSGSLVMFVDKYYGREKLIALLPYNRIDQVLKSLGTTEAELLKGWKQFMLEK